VETWFFQKRFGVRAGGNSSNGGLGISYRHSLGRYAMHFDYAFILPFFVQETAGTHRISFALRR
jgi:hypothetical protein